MEMFEEFHRLEGLFEFIISFVSNDVENDFRRSCSTTPSRTMKLEGASIDLGVLTFWEKCRRRSGSFDFYQNSVNGNRFRII